MKRKIVGVVLSILLIVVMGAVALSGFIMHRNAESEEPLDYEATYGISGNQYTVTFNNEIKDYKGLEQDGRVYLSLSGIISGINSRFYWDSNESVLIYTGHDFTVKVKPDENLYYLGAETANLDYTPLKTMDGELYMAVDFLKMFTQMEIGQYTAPNRLVIRTKWDECKMVTIAKDTYLRYRGGIKAEIFREAKAGEQLYVLDDSYDEWTMVASSDGYIGWVADKYLSGEAQLVTPQAPELPQYHMEAWTPLGDGSKIKMVWHQVMSEAANANFDADTEGVSGVNVISPTWFAFNDTDGNIRSIASADYVQKAHAKGMKVWALFSNQFPNGEDGSLGDFSGSMADEVLAYTSKRETAVNQLISYAVQAGVDGINLDFEKIMVSEESENAAKNYMQFVRELSQACHKNNLVLSIDNYVPMYTKHYDRAEQNIFADYLVIMGYDEYTAGSAEAGPGSSIGFVKQGIEDTLASVPNNKIINGIPLYTRVWKTTPEGLQIDGNYGMTTIQEIIVKHNVTPTYLDEMGLNYVAYQSDVDGNQYQMWIEDETAVKNKMELIKKYDLAGVACWKLGQQEKVDIWSVINSYF